MPGSSSPDQLTLVMKEDRDLFGNKLREPTDARFARWLDTPRGQRKTKAVIKAADYSVKFARRHDYWGKIPFSFVLDITRIVRKERLTNQYRELFLRVVNELRPDLGRHFEIRGSKYDGWRARHRSGSQGTEEAR